MKDKALEKLSKNELLELMLYLRKEYDKLKKASRKAGISEDTPQHRGVASCCGSGSSDHINVIFACFESNGYKYDADFA